MERIPPHHQRQLLVRIGGTRACKVKEKILLQPPDEEWKQMLLRCHLSKELEHCQFEGMEWNGRKTTLEHVDEGEPSRRTLEISTRIRCHLDRRCLGGNHLQIVGKTIGKGVLAQYQSEARPLLPRVDREGARIRNVLRFPPLE